MKTLSIDPRPSKSLNPQIVEPKIAERFWGDRGLRSSRARNRRFQIITGFALFSISCTWCFNPAGSVAQSIEHRSTDNNPVPIEFPIEFPYRAKVRAARAEIYSGPGKVHYPTGQLKKGETVEVYRLDPGGWCAIRPPEGSFSLVPATAIQELEDSIGEVIEPDVQAWVGTELGPVEIPLWQVKLKLGEKVELLGVVNWPDPDGFSTSWYQIASPAGEFRWVKQDDIFVPPAFSGAQPIYSRNDSSVSEEMVQTNDPLDPTPVRAEDSGNEFFPNLKPTGGTIVNVGFETDDEGLNPTTSPSRQPRSDADRSAGSTLGWRRATRPIHQMDWNQPNSSKDGINRPTFSGFENVAGVQPPDRIASSRFDSRFELEQLVPSQSWTMGPISNRLTELELRLNKEMLKEPIHWRLHDIREATQKVIDSSQDSLEQMQAQRFLEKLENCRRIRDNSVKMSAAPITTNRSLSNLDRQVGASQGTDSFDEDFSLATRYDAHGRLNQLVREGGKREATYVLQDETGKITHHVSPGPGMSLSSYVGKRVGIMGQRGYHTRLKLDHVTAANVIELKSR